MVDPAHVEIGPVAVGEYDAFMRVASRQFHADTILDSPDDRAWRERRWSTQRLLAARAAGTIVGTYRSWDEAVAVPGGTVTANLISTVTVSPTHRRQGVLTAMIRRDLERAAAGGTAVAYLIASSALVYGRFGFGAAVEHATWTVDADPTLFPLDAAVDSLGVQLCEDADLRAIAPDVYERAYGRTPGAIARDGAWWDGALGIANVPDAPTGPRYGIVVRDAEGTVVGYARYVVNERSRQRVDASVLTVRDLVATTDAAYARLWHFLASIDLTRTLVAKDRPPSESLPWVLTDRRGARQSDRADFGWIRILNVQNAFESRRYAIDGSIVVEVVDADGFAAGTYRLRVSNGAATVTETSDRPDVAMDVRTLGSLYLGQIPATELAGAGAIVEHSAGAVVRLGALLSYPGAGSVTLTWF